MSEIQDFNEIVNHGCPGKNAVLRWIWVVLFSIAFAWVESSVVVYLREIYFDGAFTFPILIEWKDGKHVVDNLMRIELGREIATIIMLAAVGCATGKNRMQIFSYFIISFGIWDIFYYIWLWVMIGWPESLITWDLLFFVPLPWVGPVVTPVIIAIVMVIAGTAIIYYDEIGYKLKLRWFDWLVEIICGCILIVAFCWDWKNIMQIPDGIVRDGIPRYFAWWLYLPALLFSVAYFIIRFKQLVIVQRK